MTLSTIITDYLGVGVAASRPTAPNVATGCLAMYFATDTGVLSNWTGSSWVSIVPLSSIANLDVLANISGGSAAPSGTTLTALIDAAIGSTQGDILYRGASSWSVLAPGPSGQVLQSGGTGANPSWTPAGGAGTVTNVATGTGLTGGPVTGTGTISLAAIASLDLLANITGGSAAPVPNTLTAVIDAAIGSTQGDILYRSGTVWSVLAPSTAGNVLTTGGAGANPAWAAATWNGGAVSSLGSHLGITGGALDVTAATLIRTVPFPIVGLPANSQQMNITMTQAGTLLANGGTPQSYIPTNPTATQTLTLNTIHSGTITARGTISISTSGVVTWPTFTAVAMAAGDTVQIVNQAVADATFANACLSLQFQVT